MESQVFRWLCVNVGEMFARLSGVSAFLFLKETSWSIPRRCCKSHLSRRMYMYRNIYLSIFLSFDLSICIFLHFKENRAVCPLVALLYVRRYVRSCCLFRMSLGLIFPLAFCLLLQNLVSSALSCLRVFLNSISALAGVLLSLCYLCAISCYLCAISVLSLCYLCYLRWGTVL
jgi:hypothetical protein